MNKKGALSLSDLFRRTNKEQIEELENTVKVRLAPSAIHGVGVVALRDIKKGEQVYCGLTVKAQWYNVPYATLKKKLREDVFNLIMDRWPSIINGSQFLSPNYDQRLTSFLNHSEDANYDIHHDVALRDIKAGEEITEDYRLMPNFDKAFPFLAEKS